MNYLKLFKKPNTKPLPTYGHIEVNDIPAASILLFYGGVKLTELVGSRLYDHPYNPPAFHAAFYCEKGTFLNVGKFRVIQNLPEEFRSTRRIDVLILPYLTSTQRQTAVEFAKMDVSAKKPFKISDYGWKDFLRFGFPGLKPSSKQICSENVVRLFDKIDQKVSDHASYDTAPWHLYERAYKHPEDFDIKTVWVGKDFKK